jgi:Flp pilus assembly protein TadG
MMRRLRRLLHGTRGQGLSEFVLAIPVFMVLFSGIYEFSRYYTTRLRIRSAVAEGARFGTIDPADGGAPEEVVTITLDYEYQVAIPLMERVLGTEVMDFSISTVMRNEPFFEEEA